MLRRQNWWKRCLWHPEGNQDKRTKAGYRSKLRTAWSSCRSRWVKTWGLWRITQAAAIYSRTSVARTLMVRLPRMFRTRSWVPLKKAHSCRYRIIFLFILIMVYCVYSLESPRWGDSNVNTQHTFILKKIKKIYLLSLLTWRYNQPSLARTTPVSN